MRMSEKCCNNNNNSDNPLTSRRTDGGKNCRPKENSMQKADGQLFLNSTILVALPISVTSHLLTRGLDFLNM